MLLEPKIDHSLNFAEKITGLLRSFFEPADVNEPPRRFAQGPFVQIPAEELALANVDEFVVRRHNRLTIVRRTVRLQSYVDLRKQKRNDLFPCPERLWLENGGLRDAAVPRVNVHQNVKQTIFGDEAVSAGELVHAEQRILDHSNHRGVALGRHNLLWREQDLKGFGARGF